jgi:hypothetical protein
MSLAAEESTARIIFIMCLSDLVPVNLLQRRGQSRRRELGTQRAR